MYSHINTIWKQTFSNIKIVPIENFKLQYFIEHCATYFPKLFSLLLLSHKQY